MRRNLIQKTNFCKVFVKNARASDIKTIRPVNNTSWYLGETIIWLHKTIQTTRKTIILVQKTIQTAGETIILVQKIIRTAGKTIIWVHKTIQTTGKTIILVHKTIRSVCVGVWCLCLGCLGSSLVLTHCCNTKLHMHKRSVRYLLGTGKNAAKTEKLYD